MPDYTLPFPGRELADQELTYDVCYAKILPQDRASIVEDSGLVCECVDKDYILETSAISVIIFRDRAVFICILALSACGRRKMV